MSKTLNNTKTNASAKTALFGDREARQEHPRDLVEHDALIVVTPEAPRALAADPNARER